MNSSSRYSSGLFALSVALVTGIAGTSHAADLATIRLNAVSYVLKADGRSTTVITAEVRDSNGNVVPDGTQVRFAVTAGRLDSDIAATQNGVARVTLTAGDLPAASLITANLETSGRATPAQITVTFASDADSAEVGTQWIRIDGKQYVGYAADKGLIQANGKDGGAHISYRGIGINADALQFGVRTNIVTALGNVTLSTSKSEKKYTNLRIDLMSGQGVAERVDEDGHSESFFIDTVPTFSEEPAKDESRGPLGYEGFQLADISDSTLTVTSKSIAIQPGRTLQFRGATFYMDGTKALSMPFHVMPLDQKELFVEQVVGVNAQGLTVDFPLYYNVQPSGVGTLHIRRGARVGSSAYSNKPGWSFDVEQNYNGKQGAEGRVEVLGLSRNDWGMRVQHAQRFTGGIEGNIYAEVPNHQDLFTSAQLSKHFSGFTLNLNGTANYQPARTDSVTGLRVRSGGDTSGQLYAATDQRPLMGSKDLRYSLNLGTTRQSYYGLRNIMGRTQVDTQYTTLRLTSRLMPVAPRTGFSQSFSLGQTWVNATGSSNYGLPRTGASILGTSALTYRLGNGGSTSLTYDYTQTPLTNGYTSNSVGHHRMGLSLFAQPMRAVTLSIGGSRGLDIPNDNASAELNIALGGPWRTRARYFTSKYVDSYATPRFNEMEYSLFYRLGGRDLAIYYSTTSRRFQFDMVGARF